MGDNETKVTGEKKNGTDNSAVRFTESDENDPCIDYKNHPKKNFWDEKERMLSEKTGLTRRGLHVVLLLLLLLLLFLIVLIALGSTWPRTPHSHQFPVCKDSSCLKAAAQIREAMNASVSPCNDLWSWACGQWLHKNSLPPDRGIWNQEAELAFQEAKRIRNLVTTLPLPLHRGTVEWKLKHLYEACLDVDSVNAVQAKPLQDIISELGGWYILRDWNIVDFDYKSILTHLHVKYGVSPYFKISVQPNPWSPGNNIITISPSGLGLPDKSYYYQDQDDPIQIAYKQFIRDVVINLSVTKTEAEKFGIDIFYYEKRIAEITPDSFDMTSFVNTYNLIKVSELHYTIVTLPLQDILAAMFPEVNINGDTEVVVSSLDYLMKVSQIVATTDRATLNSYMMWTLAREYLPYLSSPFTDTINSFNRDLLGIKQPIPRWEKCANLVYRFAGLAIENLLEKEQNIIKTTHKIVNNMFESIRDAVKQHIEKYKMTPDFYRHLSKKISGLKIQISLPQEVLNDSYVKQYYSKLIVMKANLFESYGKGINFLKKIEEQHLIAPEPEDIFVTYALSKPFSVSYIPSANAIIIPRVLVNEPYFDNKYASSILYGRLGVQIANAVVSSVVPFESGWGANLKLLLPVHFLFNESLRIAEGPKTCLSKFFVDNEMVSDAEALQTSLSVLKELSAVKFAYFALHSSLAKEEHIHQPTLEEFEDDSLFFLSYSQTHCSVLTTQQNLYRNRVDFKLSQESVLKVAKSHYPPFLESLDCSINNKNRTHCDDIF